jgi:hypothetical protein
MGPASSFDLMRYRLKDTEGEAVLGCHWATREVIG